MNRDKLNQAYVLDAEINHHTATVQMISENKYSAAVSNMSDKTRDKVMKYALSLLKKELKELNEKFNKL